MHLQGDKQQSSLNLNETSNTYLNEKFQRNAHWFSDRNKVMSSLTDRNLQLSQGSNNISGRSSEVITPFQQTPGIFTPSISMLTPSISIQGSLSTTPSYWTLAIIVNFYR